MNGKHCSVKIILKQSPSKIIFVNRGKFLFYKWQAVMPAKFYYDLFEVKELISETARKLYFYQKKNYSCCILCD